MTGRVRSSIDAYRGNLDLFWPRLYSVSGRLPRLLAESRGSDAGVGSPLSPRPIPASIFEVASPGGREAAKERAGL